MRLKKTIVSLASLFATGVISFAQVQSVAMPFLEIDQNPVTSGMAGASALRTYESTDILISYQDWALSSSKYFNAAGNIVIADKLIVRVTGTYGMNDSYELATDLNSTPTKYTPSDMFFGAAAAYRFLPTMSVEAGVKYAISKLAPDYEANAFAADVFVKGHFSGFSAAAGVINIGKSGNYGIPTAAVVAIAYDNGSDKNHRVRPEVDAKYYFAGVFGLSAGIDYTIMNIVSIRAGYHYGGIIANHASVGLGLKIRGIHIDASYLFKTSLCIGLGYSF